MTDAIITGLAAFVGTNIDDLFLNAVFYAEADTPRKKRHILLGKYLGIGLLILVSLLGAWGLTLVPEKLLGLLGLIPIALGVRAIVSTIKGQSDEQTPTAQRAGGLLARVILITVANGADNLGVYIPLFTGFNRHELLICLAVFALMIALWCLAGSRLSALPLLHRLLSRYRHVIVPVVYVSLGLTILLKAYAI
ncbi:MAG: cadmium resistance transporter [Clostridia bacterium]|nr:cadmium resistance transporter [Clostridia bacterium]